jgi:hypothetical protein
MPATATGDELQSLCRACGMCCDGSLFGRVPLDGDEVAPARAHGLRVLPDVDAIAQPCIALVAAGTGGPQGSVCSVYDRRPRACRRFACRLFERHRSEGGPLEPRLEAVRRVRALARVLEESGLSPGDFARRGDARVEALRGAHEELVLRLEEYFARAR